MKKTILGLILIAALLPVNGAEAADKLKVAASSTMFADLAKRIGGDNVDVTALASPKFNIHFYQPTPTNVRNTAKADLFVFAGLDLEAWVDPLLEAAGKPELFRGGSRNVDLSQGITLLKPPAGPLSRSMGDQHLFGNPHFNLNPENLRIMAGTLLEKFKEIDSSNAASYEANTLRFEEELDKKIREWKGLCSGCSGKEIVSYHEDIEYLADFLGLKAEQFIESKPGIPPTPKHLQFMEGYIRDKGIKAIVLPTYYPRDAADALARKVDAKVVTVCQNAGEVPGTEDVFGFFDYNVRQINEALKS